MTMTNTQDETVAKAVDGGKDAEPALLHQAAEERICECGAAGSGEGHSSFCPWLSSQWKRWGDAINAPSPAPSQHTGWSEEAVEAAARALCRLGTSFPAIELANQWVDGHWRRFEGEARAALSAASSISPATGFEVNKLQWYGDFNSTAYADSVFGKFAAWIIGGSAYVRAPWFDAGGVIAGRTKEDAEAAAIKLITERIRSSISPTVTAKDGEAWQHIASAPECDWTRGEKPTDAILYSPQFGVRTGTVCSFRGETYGSVSNLHGNAVTDWGATHWQPLPTPPAKDTQP